MKLLVVLTLHLTFTSLAFADDIKLSDRSKDGNLQRIFSASRDGYILFKALFDQGSVPDLTFGRLTNAKQSHPSFLAKDPKYNTDPPRRPIRTTADLTIIRQVKAEPEMKTPTSIDWDELVLDGSWSGPNYTAFQGLTEAGFDPFAHDGELAFRFDTSMRGRNQFAGLLIVPDGWGSQLDMALAWRMENHAVFERKILVQEEIEALRTQVRSINPLIRKLAAGLLMQQKAMSIDEMKAWLRSEGSLIDVAVAVQLILVDTPKANVLVMPGWMIVEGERLWGGALAGATLLYAQNQKAVTAMMHYHAKLRETKQILTDEIIALIQVGKNQTGYDAIEVIAEELIKTNALHNYPIFTIGNQMLGATNIVDRKLLLFDSVKQ